MLGLVYTAASRDFPNDDCGGVLGRLREEQHSVARRVLRMSAKLVRLQRVLEREGVKAVAFKGAVLSQQAYSDPVLRAFGDIDLLLDGPDVLRARAVLAAHGFSAFKGPFDGPADAVLLRLGREIVMQPVGGGPLVELHNQAGVLLGGTGSLSARRILERARTVDLFGHAVLAPAEEDLLLMQCLHGTRHAWTSLEHVACAAFLVQRVPDDRAWRRTLDDAAAAGALRKLLVGTLLACIVSGQAAPGPVVEALTADPAALGLVERALIPLTTVGPPSTTCAPISQGSSLAAYEDTWAAMVRLRLRRTFMPSYEDWESLRLPPWAFSLYFGYRPVRLARKYLRRATMASPSAL